MKVYQTLSYDCHSCGGRGFLFYGNNEDYSIEACDCVAKAELEFMFYEV